jgi:hypothetical protein
LPASGAQSPAPGRELAGEDRQDRVVAELVVVHDVLVSERDAEDALAHEGADLVLDPLRHPGVAEARGKAADQADGAVRRVEQQRASVRGDCATIEGGHHAAALDGCKVEQRRATLRRHRGPLLRLDKSLSQKNFRRFRTPMHLRLVRNPARSGSLQAIEPNGARGHIPAMSYLLAVIVPPLAILFQGRPVQAVFNGLLWIGGLLFILLPFVAGQAAWLIAVIWAIAVVYNRKSEARDRRMIDEALRRRG